MRVPYRPIPIQKSLSVNSIHSVYHFQERLVDDPYEEQYPFWQVSFLIRGNGAYEVEDEIYPLNGGDVLFRKANRKSTVLYEKKQLINIAIISFSSDSELLNELPTSPVRLYGEERATLLDLIQTGTRICTHIPPNPYDQGFTLRPDTPEIMLEYVALSLERFLIMVLCRLKGFYQQESDKSNRHNMQASLASEIHGMLETRIFERIRLENLAKEYGLSVSGLVKLYKREYGVPLIEDFIRMKMRFAKRQIRRGCSNFSEIAELLGFSSAAYFSRVFHRTEGLSPTEYSRLVTKKWADEEEEKE